MREAAHACGPLRPHEVVVSADSAARDEHGARAEREVVDDRAVGLLAAQRRVTREHATLKRFYGQGHAAGTRVHARVTSRVPSASGGMAKPRPLPRSLIRAYCRGMVTDDPTLTNPDHYRALWENEFVRVLEYTDEPGDRTTPHEHPNSVMVTLSAFSRKLSAGDREFETELPFGHAAWIPAQRHSGENTGDTSTHTIFIELKGAAAGEMISGALGPVV